MSETNPSNSPNQCNNDSIVDIEEEYREATQRRIASIEAQRDAQREDAISPIHSRGKGR